VLKTPEFGFKRIRPNLAEAEATPVVRMAKYRRFASEGIKNMLYWEAMLSPFATAAIAVASLSEPRVR